MQTPTIPRSEDVNVRSGLPNWRISQGALCRGREEDGSLEKRNKLVGLLRRIGIFHGSLDDGRTYSKLEIDLETSEGMQSIGSTFKTAHNQPSYLTTITFGEGLIAAAKDELICVEATAGTKKNRYGNYGTFANVYKVDPATLRSTPIRERSDDSLTYEEKLERVLSTLEKHPAFGERPRRKTDDYYEKTPSWQIFADEVAEAGKWPTWEKAMAGYMQMCQKLEGKAEPFEHPDEVAEPTWATMRQGHKENVERDGSIPKILQPFLTQVETGEADPFK